MLLLLPFLLHVVVGQTTPSTTNTTSMTTTPTESYSVSEESTTTSPVTLRPDVDYVVHIVYYERSNTSSALSNRTFDIHETTYADFVQAFRNATQTMFASNTTFTDAILNSTELNSTTSNVSATMTMRPINISSGFSIDVKLMESTGTAASSTLAANFLKQYACLPPVVVQENTEYEACYLEGTTVPHYELSPMYVMLSQAPPSPSPPPAKDKSYTFEYAMLGAAGGVILALGIVIGMLRTRGAPAVYNSLALP